LISIARSVLEQQIQDGLSNALEEIMKYLNVAVERRMEKSGDEPEQRN